MKDIARQLRSIIAAVEPRLSQMSSEDTGFKPAQKEWSKKEILGHLIDSAANNHQRFVRAVNNIAAQFPTYDQNEWVAIQRYNERPWASLIALWSAYNNHLAHVIECIPEEAGPFPCNIGKEDPVPLDFVIKDYHRHVLHHLKDILEEQI
jgi:hypothetical protein